MHVISRKALLEFSRRHPDSRTALDTWFHILETNQFDNFEELRKIFPSTDNVDDLYVFNISGNKYRLVASIHFNRRKIYIRYVMTHSEYDKGKWKV